MIYGHKIINDIWFTIIKIIDHECSKGQTSFRMLLHNHCLVHIASVTVSALSELRGSVQRC
jgi:hypothetical protein